MSNLSHTGLYEMHGLPNIITFDNNGELKTSMLKGKCHQIHHCAACAHLFTPTLLQVHLPLRREFTRIIPFPLERQQPPQRLFPTTFSSACKNQRFTIKMIASLDAGKLHIVGDPRLTTTPPYTGCSDGKTKFYCKAFPYLYNKLN